VITAHLLSKRLKRHIEAVHEGTKPFECQIYSKEKKIYEQRIESVHKGNKLMAEYATHLEPYQIPKL